MECVRSVGPSLTTTGRARGADHRACLRGTLLFSQRVRDYTSGPTARVNLVKTYRIVALAALAGVGVTLGSCSDAPSTTNGAKGEAGEAGPAGPPGPAGPAGRVIRFVDGECSQACIIACENNERILDTIAINPGGTFIFDADNKATFRPEQQDRPVKVILACVRK